MNPAVYRILLVIAVVGLTLGLGNFLSGPEEDIVAPKPTGVSLTPDQKKHLNTLAPTQINARIKPTTNPGVFAKGYIVLDPTTNYPLIEKNADTRLPIASTTKIMTALVALEELKLDQVVTIPREAAVVEGSEIQLLTNETMTVKNLLYALLIKSANDGAMALAMAGGNKDDFIAKMNVKAQLLGMTNTEYKDPAGLDDTAYSTPRDLAILTRYALSNQVFREIVKTSKYTIWSSDNKYKHDLVNSNRLVVPEESLYMTNAIGVKTGTTDGAGHCLVSAATLPDGRIVVAVVLNTMEYTNTASAKESRKLLIWAQNVLNKV